MHLDNTDYQHPAFPQPANRDAAIWRYMHIDRFRSLIETSSLYMARADRLGDDFEGTTPSGERNYWNELIKLAATEEERIAHEYNRDQRAEFAAAFREQYYVSCWHMADDENVTMWERYGKERPHETVAIRTTYSTLRQQLVPRQIVELGLVSYIDYAKDRLPSYNMLQNITHKRHFYRDEREVRAVMWRMHGNREVAQQYIEPFITPDGLGFLQPVAIRDLIKEVVLNPKSTPAFADDVAAICARGDLAPPTMSKMAGTPAF